MSRPAARFRVRWVAVIVAVALGGCSTSQIAATTKAAAGTSAARSKVWASSLVIQAKTLGSKAAPYVKQYGPFMAVGAMVDHTENNIDNPAYGTAYRGCWQYFFDDARRRAKCEKRATGPRSTYR